MASVLMAPGIQNHGDKNLMEAECEEARVRRIFQLTHEVARCNVEYQKAELEHRRLGQLIVEHLGDNRMLFMKYESLLYYAESFCIEAAYNAGLEEANANQNANQNPCKDLKQF